MAAEVSLKGNVGVSSGSSIVPDPPRDAYHPNPRCHCSIRGKQGEGRPGTRQSVKQRVFIKVSVKAGRGGCEREREMEWNCDREMKMRLDSSLWVSVINWDQVTSPVSGQ